MYFSYHYTLLLLAFILSSCSYDNRCYGMEKTNNTEKENISGNTQLNENSIKKKLREEITKIRNNYKEKIKIIENKGTTFSTNPSISSLCNNNEYQCSLEDFSQNVDLDFIYKNWSYLPKNTKKVIPLGISFKKEENQKTSEVYCLSELSDPFIKELIKSKKGLTNIHKKTFNKLNSYCAGKTQLNPHEYFEEFTYSELLEYIWLIDTFNISISYKENEKQIKISKKDLCTILWNIAQKQDITLHDIEAAKDLEMSEDIKKIMLVPIQQIASENQNFTNKSPDNFDKKINISQTGAQVFVLKKKPKISRQVIINGKASDSSIITLALNKNETYLASLQKNGVVGIWDTEFLFNICKFEIPNNNLISAKMAFDEDFLNIKIDNSLYTYLLKQGLSAQQITFALYFKNSKNLKKSLQKEDKEIASSVINTLDKSFVNELLAYTKALRENNPSTTPSNIGTDKDGVIISLLEKRKTDLKNENNSRMNQPSRPISSLVWLKQKLSNPWISVPLLAGTAALGYGLLKLYQKQYQKAGI